MSDNQKDFDRYVYFVSKAKNYAVCYKPEIKEVDMYGQQKKLQAPVRIEFYNGMKKLEKTKENMPFIEFLRERIKAENEKNPRSRTLWEETPNDSVPADTHKEAIKDKDQEIEDLKKQIETTQKNTDNTSKDTKNK